VSNDPSVSLIIYVSLSIIYVSLAIAGILAAAIHAGDDGGVFEEKVGRGLGNMGLALVWPFALVAFCEYAIVRWVRWALKKTTNETDEHQPDLGPHRTPVACCSACGQSLHARRGTHYEDQFCR
jgi:hypothetical protein